MPEGSLVEVDFPRIPSDLYLEIAYLEWRSIAVFGNYKQIVN